MTRDQIIQALREHALEKLKILQGYDEVKRDFVATAKAYRSMTGQDIPGAEQLSTGTPGPGKLAYGDKAKQVLRALLAHGEKGVRAKTIAIECGMDPKHIPSTMRRLHHNKFAHIRHVNKEAWYSITASGKNKLAQSIGAPDEDSAKDKANNGSKGNSKNANNHPRKKYAGERTCNTLNALTVLDEQPSTTRQVVEALGLHGDRDSKRMSVILPYLRQKGWAKSTKTDAGVVYEITNDGRERLSQMSS